MDFTSLVTSVGTSFVVFLVLLLLYVWLASKKGNQVVYYPSRMLKGKAKDGYVSKTGNPLRWMVEAWRASEDDIIAAAGLDAAVYLTFIATALAIMVLSSAVCLPLLLPLSATDRNNEIERQKQLAKDRKSATSYDDFDNLAMGNVQPKSNRLWGFLAAAYFVSFVTYLLLWKTYKHVLYLRTREQASLEAKPEQFVVLVRDIPPVPPGKTRKEQVDSFFRKLHPDTFDQSLIVSNISEANKVWVKIEGYRKKLARAEFVFEESKTRPTHKSGFLGLTGKSVDSIDFYNEKIKDLMLKLNTKQKIALTEKQANAAFILFNSRPAATAASQVVHSQLTDTWTVIPSQEQIEESLAGNLCRCTGYRPILDAFRVFAKTDNSLYINCASLSKSKDAKVICPSTGKPCECGASDGNDSNASGTLHPLSKSLSYSEIDGSYYTERELIFPSELVSRKPYSLYLKGPRDMIWFRPLKLQDVLDLKSKFPEAKLLVGNTEIGIETKFKSMCYQVIIAATHVPELNILRVKDSGLEIGASVTLTELLDTLKQCVAECDEHETSVCSAFVEQLRWFAGHQIRNVASVGGNICTASPISDLNPLWMAARAQFNITDTKGNVRTVFARDFFKGYRKVDLRSGEILLSVFLPFTRLGEYVKEFKQAHRRDDDIALVNAAMRVLLEQKGHAWSVIDASIVYGGVAPVPLSAVRTETFLKGKPWTSETLQCALQVLKDDIIIAENAPGGMVEFRRSLTASFFFKFFLLISYNIQQKTQVLQGFPDSYKSAVDPYKRPSSYGVQSYESPQKGTSVGLPVVHLAAKLQVTGEAEYADDVPMPYNGLHAALVLSKKPHAQIHFIDDSAAKLLPGFEGFFTSKDVPGGNDIGPVINDEELFASKFVTSVGQVIGIVVADTHENAKTASQKIQVEYENLPAVLCIKDALRVGSFHPNTEKILQKGDVNECFNSGVCQKIIEGEVQIGGQEHFYLEPNSTLIWTADGGNEVHMISSTQAPQKHQKFVSHVLGIPMNKVVCKTKRLGGGFGGKETRSAFIAAAAAVPSYLLRRPVRITLDRDIDMMITGQRHAFLGKYKVGFSEEGKVLALDLEIYNNGGNSLDLSLAVLERAMFHSDNVYAIENVRIRGKVCFTHLPSNTAFRGFGGPQGMFVTENWIEHISRELGKRPEEIKERNFHKEGHVLHYGQKLEQCRLQQVWNALKVSCDFDVACLEVGKFNSLNRWKKRGLAMIPTKFGISFTTKFMNQAGALVQVYTDGTVLVTHGGVEMGQGLHTKVAQIAATAFNIPVSSVFISETSTDKVPNSSPTAASASSDMYGAAVLDACEQIKSRMEPIASKNKHASFAELANACHLERIDLSAHGFYATPDIGFDWKSGKGRPFSYYTFGAAYAEVEVDTLTGDFHLREADIVMDLGNSLNPAIDIGQIEGAFVQGLGLFALEEVKWGDPAHQWVRPGYLFTQGPGTYKLPTVNDIPLKFKVSLLKDAPNQKAIHSSKAVGEPPLFLASAAFFAIKDAISAARLEVGNEGWFVLDSPATPERIRMACPDEFTKPFANSEFRAKLSV